MAQRGFKKDQWLRSGRGTIDLSHRLLFFSGAEIINLKILFYAASACEQAYARRQYKAISTSSRFFKFFQVSSLPEQFSATG
jgi:hypothetical protein